MLNAQKKTLARIRAAKIKAQQQARKKAQKQIAQNTSSTLPAWKKRAKPSQTVVKDNLTTALSLLNKGRHPTGNKHNNIISIKRASNSHQRFTPRSSHRLTNLIHGNVEDGRDLAAGWQASWDEYNLHIRVDISDQYL